MAKPKAHHGRKAWLVTWEWAGDHAKPADKVVAIFSPHLGGGRVRELVELLYMQSIGSLSERVSWALDKSSNPYPAQLGTLNNVPWEGEITCGHNPWLLARLVDDLTVEVDADGKEHAAWKERPKPDLSWIHNKTPRRTLHDA